MEFAPFLRNHSIPIIKGETNKTFIERLEKLIIKHFYLSETEVLEYFLSYDILDFCASNSVQEKRVREDIAYYKNKNISKLSTFLVFPNNRVDINIAANSIKKFTEMVRSTL